MFPVAQLCKIIGVSRSAYYAWLKRLVKHIALEQPNLYRSAKAIFKRIEIAWFTVS